MAKPQKIPRRWAVGVIHLPPLPGSPRYVGEDFVESAFRDARALADAGFDAVLVENFGDAPFFKDSVPPETVAAMAVAVREVKEAVAIPVGVNVLRNDARAAIGIAAAAGATFIRVNVHTGASVTDQGIIEGRAAETLRARATMRTPIAIFADVNVKHAAPIVHTPLELAVEDTVRRGLADVVIVTGPTTGRPPDVENLERARAGLRGSFATLYAGSGVTADNVGAIAPHVDGVIVGTSLKRDAVTANAVDPAAARAFMKAWKLAVRGR
jgi:membrane complex biogenesis BtpA family protein